MKRLFVALFPSPLIVQNLSLLQAEIKDFFIGRPVNPEYFHLTLKYFGWIQKQEENRILSILESYIPTIPSFRILLSSVGFFPNCNNPKIAFVRMENRENILHKINRDLGILFPQYTLTSKRVFTPHVTLFRIQGFTKTGVRFNFEKYKKTQFGKQKIDRIILCESKVSSVGTVYAPVKEIYTTPT